MKTVYIHYDRMKALDFIKKYYEKNCFMPSYREIGEYMGCKTPATVKDILTQLEKDKFIKIGHKARAIVLLNDRRSKVSKENN